MEAAGVYIKGFEKPKNCKRCPMNYFDLHCSITKGAIDRDDFSNEKECPMIPCYLKSQISEVNIWSPIIMIMSITNILGDSDEG